MTEPYQRTNAGLDSGRWRRAPSHAEQDLPFLELVDTDVHEQLVVNRTNRRRSITTDKFCCPFCKTWKSRVVDSRPDTQGVRYLRWRHCAQCHQLFETAETVTGRQIALHEEHV